MENDNRRVQVSLGYTANLGNFESLRIDIGWTDVVHSGESQSEATDRIYSEVEEKLLEKIKEVKEAI